jgi:hypothetical protein
MSTTSSGYTSANSPPFARGLASKESRETRFLLSVAIVAIGISFAVWALTPTHAGFSPDEFGLMTALP